MSIELYPVIPGRPCSFCLCLQEGSVFADLDVDNDNNVTLLRISYDGYGCCNAADLPKMKTQDSALLLSSISSMSLNAPAVKEVLRRYFREIRDLIWPDSLEEHGLVQAETPSLPSP